MSDEPKPFTHALAVLWIVIIAFRATGLVSWSWWWVLSPLWVAAGVFGIMLGVLVLLDIAERKGRRS